MEQGCVTVSTRRNSDGVTELDVETGDSRVRMDYVNGVLKVRKRRKGEW